MNLVNKSIEKGKRAIDLKPADDPHERVRQEALKATQLAEQAKNAASNMWTGIDFPTSSVPRERIGNFRKINVIKVHFKDTEFKPILTYQVKIDEDKDEDKYLRLYMDEFGRFAMKVGSKNQSGDYTWRPVRYQEKISMSQDALQGLSDALDNLDDNLKLSKNIHPEKLVEFRVAIADFKKSSSTKNLSALSHLNIGNVTESLNVKDRKKRMDKNGRPNLGAFDLKAHIGDGDSRHPESLPKAYKPSKGYSEPDMRGPLITAHVGNGGNSQEANQLYRNRENFGNQPAFYRASVEQFSPLGGGQPSSSPYRRARDFRGQGINSPTTQELRDRASRVQSLTTPLR